ncbi:MAG: hypothetical protein LWX51_12640 [Deltaproteobacteria bacterium]|jgi:hypothetical protein|nr:hypothetical protein [Deltaproteobacteria bacterium]
MTHQYAKSIRKKLREPAGLAHERELSGHRMTIYLLKKTIAFLKDML